MDHRVVGLLLDASGVEVVVDDVLAEDPDGRLRPLELTDRLEQPWVQSVALLEPTPVAADLAGRLLAALDGGEEATSE